MMRASSLQKSWHTYHGKRVVYVYDTEKAFIGKNDAKVVVT
jgi:hypothetical protein